MAWCRWCQMESDDGNQCVWCRRAIVPSGIVGRNFGPWAPEDERARTFGAWPLAGLGVFLSSLAIGWVAMGSPLPAKKSGDVNAGSAPKVEVAVWSGMGKNTELTRDDDPPPPAPSVAATLPPAPARRSAAEPDRFAPVNSPANLSPAGAQVASASVRRELSDQFGKSESLPYLESAEFTVQRTESGGNLQGTLWMVNPLDEEIFDVKLTLSTSGGDLNVNVPDRLPARRTSAIKLSIKGVSSSILEGKDRTVTFTAKSKSQTLSGDIRLVSKSL